MANVPFAIRFVLRELAKVQPWGKPGQRSLHWYSLSDGCYCIETAAGQLLRNNDDELEPGLSEPWLSYQVARLFEDLLDLWPALAEPVPQDVMARFERWYDLDRFYAGTDGDDDAVANLWEIACRWSFDRDLDFGYLALEPRLQFHRMGDTVEIRWTGSAHWDPAHAVLRVPFSTVEAAIRSFCDAFLDAMALRVAEIQQNGLPHPECAIDIPELVHEQSRRQEMFVADFARRRSTD